MYTGSMHRVHTKSVQSQEVDIPFGPINLTFFRSNNNRHVTYALYCFHCDQPNITKNIASDLRSKRIYNLLSIMPRMIFDRWQQKKKIKADKIGLSLAFY